ncbi:hypothetical protein FRC07_004364 [Ceratobasidium sp. 392]|nr:hypothetical protein FRC07_004364 [Ceratobasidium sp. 392]
MAATKENPIIFYDIVAKDGEYWTPNPYKTRLSLDYKGLPYRVKYLKIEDVEPTMKAMGIPPTSTTSFPNYTLPMIVDPSNDPNGEPTYVSDSFKIAIYLDEKYPAPKYPTTLPPETRALQKIFVESYFPTTLFGPMFPVIGPRVPGILDERSREYMYRSRGGKDKFDRLSDIEEAQQFALAKEKWGEFAQVFDLTGGPWVMGDKPMFADFVIGCAFSFWRKVDSDGKVWKEVASWQGGRWDEYWKRIEAIENKSTTVA